LNIFVASTYSDLKSYRDTARRVIQGLAHRAELVEPLAGVEPDGIAQLLRAILRTCHGCVLIVGSRRGSGPRDATDGIGSESYTTIEFLEAIKANVPLIPFFLDSTTPADDLEREWVRQFRNHISSYSEPIQVSSLDEFEATLPNRLVQLARQTPVNPSERETRKIDEETFQQLFGTFKDGALEFITDAKPGDMEAQRRKAQLQGYPLDTSTAAFKQADQENDEGWTCHERGAYALGLMHFERALVLCRAFPLVWNNKGLAHFRMGDLELAKQCYFNAVQFAPGFVKPWSNLAFLYWAGFEDGEATRRWLDRALAIAPDYPDALVIEAALRLVATLEPLVRGEMDRRRVRLLKRFPREMLLFQMPGVQAMMRREYAEAIGQFHESRRTAPQVVEFVDPIAECLCHLGRFSEAESFAREALQLDPAYASAWVNLSWACAGQGDFASCRDAAKQALAIDGFPETRDAAASNAVIALCQLRAFSDALALIAEFASTHPESQHPAALWEYVANRMQGGE